MNTLEQRRVGEQINPESGLAERYTNEYNIFVLRLGMVVESSENLAFFLQIVSNQAVQNNGLLIHKYEDICEIELVAESNRQKITEVNTIAEEINTAYSSHRLTIRDLLSAAQKVWDIIRCKPMSNRPELPEAILNTILE